jgi:hypothetical protein
MTPTDLSRRPTAVRMAVLTAVLAASACGGSGVKLYPVSGKVLFQDQPVEGVTVIFHPVGGDALAPRPSGTTGPDGSFALKTHPLGDGAPAGEYVVVATWYASNARELENPRSKLPARYGDQAKSNLKATVTAGPTALEPFRLTK